MTQSGDRSDRMRFASRIIWFKQRFYFKIRWKKEKSVQKIVMNVSPLVDFTAKLITEGEQSYIILGCKKVTCLPGYPQKKVRNS
jgi:hypothetical protein